MDQPPPLHVLENFGLNGPAIPLEGGSTQCYRVEDAVLKPVDDVEETGYISRLQTDLIALDNPGYRLAEPRKALAGEYVVDNWSAVCFLAGKTGPIGRWADLIDASRAFHLDLKGHVDNLPPFVAKRTHRWALADRIAWDEETVDIIPVEIHPPLKALLQNFLALRDTFEVGEIQQQLVHGDLCGNVTFCDKESGLSPGIIDLSMYWRPVEFAEAIVVADALTDHNDTGPLMLTGTSRFRVQMLVRALSFRLISDSIGARNDPSRAKEIEDVFMRAFDLVSGLILQC